ncbi:MAG: glutamine amidotransferase [Miniphocaeibacter sp.]|uniref:glutamine amidotransferase n=1 Tax=Miniphocaeibacter sp. TaxID=3100973 RepID=UPI0017C3F78A|nr:cytoplasmic protein [Gallicola sp.]
MKKILIAGESWVTYTIHQKGFDSFTTTTYEEGVMWLKDAFENNGHEVNYIPNHRVQYDFPNNLEEISKYDVVILSDIGSNTLLLKDNVFISGNKDVDNCQLIKDYVLNGGSFIMMGGYMAFSGINGTSRYEMTPIADILPVKCLGKDDRAEHPAGVYPQILKEEHEVFKGMEKEWPHFLGYNKTIAIEDSEILATIGDDPFIVVKSFGKGKSAVFTSDCAPHWGPMEFVEWKSYPILFNNLVDYITK